MKVNTKVLALMALLAAGVAGAQSVDANKGTNAGTEIINVATATFNDPTSTAPTPPTVSVNSNPVKTTVQPKYAFNITYADGTADTGDTSVLAGAPTTYTKTLLPNDTAVFKYAAVNNGNAPQTITLSSADVGVEDSTIKFYPAAADTNGDGTLSKTEIDAANAAGASDAIKPINSIKVAAQGDDPSTAEVENNTGIEKFFMVYTVPGGNVTQAGATPIGTGKTGTGTYSSVPPYFGGGTDTTESATNLFLQYNKVNIAKTGVLVGQNGNPAGDGTDLYESVATTAATGVLAAPKTSIQENGEDKQTAQVNNTQTAVNFTNTLKNPVTDTNAPNDTYALTADLPTGVTSVKFLLPSGAAFPNTRPTTPNVGTLYYYLKDGKPTIEGVAPGATADFIVQAELPTGAARTGTPTITVTVTSANAVAAGATVTTDTTKDIVAYPSGIFGDNVNKSATNNTPDPSANPNPSVGAGTTATLPMAVKNTSSAPDTYTLPTNATVTFKVVGTDGVQSDVTKTITYVKDTNCDGTADDPSTTVTTIGPVAAGATMCVVATVDVPDNAVAGTTPTITQTVTSANGLTLTDNNDTITVNLSNTNTPPDNSGGKGLNIVKAKASTSETPAVPGAKLDYTITATNTYNANIKNFSIVETNGTLGNDGTSTSNVFNYSCFVSVSGAVTNPALAAGAKVLYRYNGSPNWTTKTTPDTGSSNASPSNTLPSGVAAVTSGNCNGGYSSVTKVEVGIDVDGNGVIDSADFLAAKQVLTVTFKTLIK